MGKNIALIGMMGCGKTTIACELSKILPEYTLVDIDCEIEKSSGKKISEIFLKYGEPHFRILESDKIKKFAPEGDLIIALGGGAFESPDNRKILLETSTVIYLQASAEEIYKRIKNEVHRPLLQKNFSVERIAEIIKKREHNYKKANLTVNTDNKNPLETAKYIIGALNG